MADNNNVLEVETEERISGAKINTDGTYSSENVEDTKTILKKFDEWTRATDTLLRTYQDDDNIQQEQTDDGLNTVMEVKSSFDKLGRALQSVYTCPICGKKIDFLTPTGYCSVACFTKDLTNRLLTHMKMENNNPINKTIKKIQEILDKVNLALNLLVELPDLLKLLIKVPERWKNYLMMNINIAFLKLRIVINKLMIKKNEKIIDLLKQVKMGNIDNKLKPIFEPINKVIEAVNALKQTLETAFNTALSAMKTYGFQINADSMGWLMTPRSMLNSDAGQVYIELPTHTMEGISTKIIPSGVLNINWNMIDDAVKKVFPPIQQAEYFMDPDLFDVRLLFSDLSDIVKQVKEKLELLMVYGLDYMPRYKNLSFINVWFILALMDGWGQHSRYDFGSLINPNV